MRSIFRIFSFIFIIFFSASCVQEEKIHSFQGKTMGTYYSVKVVANEIDRENMQLQIDELLREVNNIFSTYIKESEVSRINRNKSDLPIAITPAMKDLVELSVEIYKKSDKYFDPTVGPLVNLWGFGPNGKRNRPSDSLIKEKLKLVGLDKINISNGSLIKRHPNIYLDFSSIAKGQGVDDLGSVLRSRGFKNFLIEIGGEILAMGKKPDGSRWAVGIEKPSSTKLGEAIQKILLLEDEAIATSGSYRNFLKYGDAVFSHTISPLTGKPIKHKLVSVSVLHKSCAQADGWATALMALGDEKGLETANRLGLKAYFLVKDGDEFIEKSSNEFN